MKFLNPSFNIKKKNENSDIKGKQKVTSSNVYVAVLEWFSSERTNDQWTYDHGISFINLAKNFFFLILFPC